MLSVCVCSYHIYTAVFMILLPMFLVSSVLAFLLLRDMQKQDKKNAKKGFRFLSHLREDYDDFIVDFFSTRKDCEKSKELEKEEVVIIVAQSLFLSLLQSVKQLGICYRKSCVNLSLLR